MPQEIKTYHQIGQGRSLSFEISKMEDAFDRRKGEPDVPHRHDFYTVLVTQKAQGTHFIDFHAYPLQDHRVYFISPGQVHQVVETTRSQGYAILFSDEFLARNNISIRFIDNLHLFRDFGDAPPLDLPPQDFLKLCHYAQEMEDLNRKSTLYKYEALGSLLKLFLITCNHSCELATENTSEAGQGSGVLQSFKSLINLHFKDWHSTNEYANALNITPDYLNRLVKAQTGKTAKEHIQSRITVAAKRLLYFSQLTNKEISYELGFNEPSNFSAFFKKCVGQSPTEFRQGPLKQTFG